LGNVGSTFFQQMLQHFSIKDEATFFKQKVEPTFFIKN
jgi:hypothetical protein